MNTPTSEPNASGKLALAVGEKLKEVAKVYADNEFYAAAERVNKLANAHLLVGKDLTERQALAALTEAQFPA